MVETLGVIYGNRDFFPDSLVTEARQEIPALLKERNIEILQLSEDQTKLGGVETYQDAKICADLFKHNRSKLNGILVILPNFGDEKSILETIKFANLDLPILIQAYPDDLDKFNVTNRRDSFCGKISVCNNLRQSGIPYSITTRHVVSPHSESFRTDLDDFMSVCRVVKGMKNARIGAIGARPGAFNTVRYSEKILERNGISVTTVDLSEIIYNAEKFGTADTAVIAKIDQIRQYAQAKKVPQESLVQMGKLALAIDNFTEENDLNATAIQCWTSLQKNLGCNACTLMSMMSHGLMPSACEVDVTGALSMYALQLASTRPAALVDWNNNYAEDENKCVLFHCGNWPTDFLPDAEIGTAPILETVIGKNTTYGALQGRTAAGPMSYARITTDDAQGSMCAYTGEGMFTDDKLDTFGSRAVVEIPNLQSLMHFICTNGFEHHTAMTNGHCACAVAEAFDTYLGWEVYHHGTCC